jgi:hypothetical protein
MTVAISGQRNAYLPIRKHVVGRIIVDAHRLDLKMPGQLEDDPVLAVLADMNMVRCRQPIPLRLQAYLQIVIQEGLFLRPTGRGACKAAARNDDKPPDYDTRESIHGVDVSLSNGRRKIL